MDSRHFLKKYWFIVLILVLEIIMILCFSFCGQAAPSYTVYGSLTVNSSVYKNYLLPYYLSSSYYSPFNSFVAFRSADHVYRLVAFCSDNSYVVFTYDDYGYQGNNYRPYFYTTLYDSAPSISFDGHLVVTSGDHNIGTVYPRDFPRDISVDEYNQSNVIYVLVLFCSIIFIFFVFRNRVNPFSDRRFK